MPDVLTINPAQSKTLERTTHSVYVAAGNALFTVGEDSELVEAEHAFDAKGAANVVIYAPDSARVVVTYADEAPAPAPKKAKKK